MSIMQQSSKAQDRTLGVWFQIIQQGMVKFPRFQCLEAEFNLFLLNRANLVVAAMNTLIDGNSPTLDLLWSRHTAINSSLQEFQI